MLMFFGFINFMESIMTERELLLHIQGFLKGIQFDPEALTDDILLHWNSLIEDSLWSDKNVQD
jgi:hypothetical protein